LSCSFVYLTLEVPGSHVDVNVHPTKREVALLHEDKLCAALSGAVRETVGGRNASRTFMVAGLRKLLTQQDEDGDRRRGPVANDSRKRQPAGNGESIDEDKATVQSAEEARTKLRPGSGVDSRRASNEENNGVEETTEAPVKQSSKRRATDGGGESSMAAKRPRDSKLVRTSPALPVGAIEPFLVQKAAAPSRRRKRPPLRGRRRSAGSPPPVTKWSGSSTSRAVPSPAASPRSI